MLLHGASAAFSLAKQIVVQKPVQRGRQKSKSRLAVSSVPLARRKNEQPQNQAHYSGAEKPVHHYDSSNITGAKKRATPDLTGALSKKVDASLLSKLTSKYGARGGT